MRKAETRIEWRRRRRALWASTKRKYEANAHVRDFKKES